jgi:hypothetical protein
MKHPHFIIPKRLSAIVQGHLNTSILKLSNWCKARFLSSDVVRT